MVSFQSFPPCSLSVTERKASLGLKQYDWIEGSEKGGKNVNLTQGHDKKCKWKNPNSKGTETWTQRPVSIQKRFVLSPSLCLTSSMLPLHMLWQLQLCCKFSYIFVIGNSKTLCIWLVRYPSDVFRYYHPYTPTELTCPHGSLSNFFSFLFSFPPSLPFFLYAGCAGS